MYNNKQLATAVFTGMVVVFLYLMISPQHPPCPFNLLRCWVRFSTTVSQQTRLLRLHFGLRCYSLVLSAGRGWRFPVVFS